jgi:hypothetical protein
MTEFDPKQEMTKREAREFIASVRSGRSGPT